MNSIETILYGSRGVSLYLGNFKHFSDTDLLVHPMWLSEKWFDLLRVMSTLGYELVDEHEHEFRNKLNNIVAFAEDTILLRDGIIESFNDLNNINCGNTIVQTLSPESFVKAYVFSEKDGYRKNSRGKKDEVIIRLLRTYLN